MKMKKLFVYLLCLLLFVSTVWSKKEKEKEEKFKYPLRHFVVVTADRLEEPAEQVSASFSVITEEEIKAKQIYNLSEILTNVPGFCRAQVGSIGHVSSLFIRGAESDHNLVLLNGIPINDPASSYFDFSSISLDDIERIEIVRGPQSTLYGSDALGGVINLITKRGERGAKFNLNFAGGSDSTYKGSFSFSAGNDFGKIYLNTSHFRTQGNFENDDYKSTTFSFRGEIKIKGDSNFEFFARHTKTELGIPFSAPQVPSFSRRQNTEETIIGIPISFSFLPSWNLKLNLSYFKRDYKFKDPASFWNYYHTKSNTLRLDFQSDFSYSTGLFTVGGEWKDFFVTNEDNFGVSIDNKKTEMRALFMQNRLHIANTFFWTAGIRLDSHNEFGVHYSPRITGAFLIKNTKLKASWGSGFRAPRPNELYSFWGNKDLKPEVSTSWEIGIEQNLFDSRLLISFTHFSSKIKDLIVYDLASWKLQNLAQTKLQGQEITFYFIPHRNFTLRAGYTRLIAKDKKTNEDLLRRPKNTYNLDVSFKPIEKFNINFHLTYIGKRKDLDEITFMTVDNPAYNLVDFSIKWQLNNNFNLFSKISNLFNKKYEEVYGYPSPDRGIYFGMEYNF
jgi:vitamin B12 transporter